MNIIEKRALLPTIREAKNAAGKGSRFCLEQEATLKVVLMCSGRDYTFWFKEYKEKDYRRSINN